MSLYLFGTLSTQIFRIKWRSKSKTYIFDVHYWRSFVSKIVLGFVFFGLTYAAQASDVVDAPLGLETTLNELDQQNQILIEDLVEEFSKDPNYIVETDQDGVTTVKKRTPPSGNPPDPEEQAKAINQGQSQFNISVGMGGVFTPPVILNNSSFNLEGKQKRLETRQAEMQVEFAVRPRSKMLKRLLVGGGFKLGETQTSGDTETYVVSRGGSQLEPYFFGEWDVLYLGKRQDRVISTGYYQGRSYITASVDVPRYRDETGQWHNREDNHKPYSERGFQFRWRGIITGASGAGNGFNYFVLTRMSINGITTLSGGFNIAFGHRLWIKEKVEK